MIEYLVILFQLLVFVLFSYFPINSSTSKYFLSSSKNLSLINYFIINLSLLMSILLIASFTKFGLENVFITLLIIYALLFLVSFKDILRINYKDNYLVITIFIIINFALFLDLARDLQLNWDALTLWKIKANHFYLGNNYFDPTYYPHAYFSHPQYPHLGTYIWSFFWKNALLDYEYLGRCFQTYLYVVSLFVLTMSFRFQSFSKIFLVLVVLIILSYDPDLRGYQDIYIFSLIIFYGFFIYEKFRLKTNLNNFIILIPLILPWIKNEGIFYSIFLLIIYFVVEKSNLKRLFFPLIILSTIFLQLYLNIFYFDLNTLFQFEIKSSNILNDEGFTTLLNKFVKILFYSSHGFFKHPILILDAFIIFISLYYLKFSKINFPYYLFLFLFIVFILSIYVFTPNDLKWHLQSSIDRLLLHTSGIYVFLLANLNYKKIIKI